MNPFGDLYTQYYDMLYQDKNYKSEVEYIDSLIKKHSTFSKSILELGCGTGRHAEFFCDLGYSVHGVDASAYMINIAEKRRTGHEDKISFSCSKIQDLVLNTKVGAVISLFHVMSYQTTNHDLIKAFEVAKKHLTEDGVFIFDFWYGPAVLTDMPVVRTKRLENEKIKITRIAEPLLIPQRNIVEVNYDIFIEDKNNLNIIEFKEIHKMRYFFDTELELICDIVGFDIVGKYVWMSYRKPDLDSWYVVWVLKS